MSAIPVSELPVDVDDEVLDSRQGVQLDELPVGTERSVDLLLDVPLEPLADHPVVEQLLVLHRRRKLDLCLIKKSPGKVPGTLPSSLSVSKPDILHWLHFNPRDSLPPSEVNMWT